MLFWLDTFAIPVKQRTPGNSSEGPPDFDELRKKSIRQIYHVFDASAHSVVIDKDLIKEDPSERDMEITMKLLTSAWMRRLWTLQEAFFKQEDLCAF